LLKTGCLFLRQCERCPGFPDRTSGQIIAGGAGGSLWQETSICNENKTAKRFFIEVWDFGVLDLSSFILACADWFDMVVN
jgi:hypothetical protein